MTETMIALKGSVPINRHPLIGPADPNKQIEITIKLRRKKEAGLPTLDEFVAGKRAKLTRQQLADDYGSTREDAHTVQQWAAQHDLSVTAVHPGKREMHLTGSIAAMSRAFGVKLSKYRHARTKTEFRCPEGEIHIPQSLQPIVRGVFGLDTMPVVVRHGLRVARKAAAADPKTQFKGSFYPNEVSKLYNFPPTQGDGQRVAVLEFGGGFDQSVLADYFTKNIGLETPPTVNPILIGSAQMDVNDGATGEVYLDIEVIGAMAPQTTIDVYFAAFTGQGFLNSIQHAVQNDDYAAVSISYGLDEDATGTAQNPGWEMLNQNVDEAFRDAAAVGIPLFISSGDQGSGSQRGFLNPDTPEEEEITVYSTAAHAGYPASSPYATAVGGTMLYAENGAITHEVVWNELGDVQQGSFYIVDATGTKLVEQQGKYYLGGATGGGVSDRYKTVPSYQSNAGVHPQAANNGAGTGRGIPDVAGNAGAGTGYLVSQPPNSQVAIAPVGGTSAAAPMWAALMACVRESVSASLNGNVPVFFLNDFIYAAGKSSAFRDIVGGQKITYNSGGAMIRGAFTAVGNNRSTGVNAYSAQKGYDLCTGWGTPNGVELLKQLESWLPSQKTAAPVAVPAAALLNAEKAARAAGPVQCKSCKSTTAIDLKLTIPPPSTAVVSSLPAADFIAITWTEAETEAAAQVFGVGQYKFLTGADNNFTPLLFPNLVKPSRENYHAHFMQVTVNGKKLILLKSEFHPKVQASETTLFFERLVGPGSGQHFKCLITSGTAGGIWASLDLGDVIVTNQARFGLTMTAEQQSLLFTGLADIVGSNPPAGFATWYDYVNSKVLATDTCLNSGLTAAGGRAASSGKPLIHYKAPSGSLTDIVTNSRITDDECGRISTYRTIGATLDENDAYVASALKAVDFNNWVSIRNVSDLPCAPSSDDQYDRFGQCSSICGAYAIWAFIMGH
jgi:kumamolisin